MKCLELFCGTKSFGKFADELGWEVVSLDINKKFKPTICTDICVWDYKQFAPDEFDIIWASPECKFFSVCRNSWIGLPVKEHNMEILTEELREKDMIEKGLPPVLKTLEILKYFKPEFWFIENPSTGKMKDFMPKDLSFIDVDYCRFGFSYRKRTRIWTNKKLSNCLCEGADTCPAMDGNIHKQRIGMAGDKTGIKQRYSIPTDLFYYLILN